MLHCTSFRRNGRHVTADNNEIAAPVSVEGNALHADEDQRSMSS